MSYVLNSDLGPLCLSTIQFMKMNWYINMEITFLIKKERNPVIFSENARRVIMTVGCVICKPGCY